MKQKYLNKKQISQIAIFIEQKILKENVGSQDQIAAAFGGFNKISFEKFGYTVEGLLNREKLDLLNKSSILFIQEFKEKWNHRKKK